MRARPSVAQLGLPHDYGKSRWLLLLLGLGALGFGLLFERALERSEKLTVDMTVSAIRTGMKAAMTEAILRGQEMELSRWPGSNPLRFLGEGATEASAACAAAERKTGVWCFDAVSGELSYRPRHAIHLRLIGEHTGTDTLRWRISGETIQEQHPPYFGLNLQLLTPYGWFDD